MNILFSRFLLPIGLLIGMQLMLIVPALAQGRAIKGKVTDEKGQPVADAQIIIQGTDIYRNFKTKTDKKGEYMYLLGLQAGYYRVAVRKAGYQPQCQENIMPELNQQSMVNFQLIPGQDFKFEFEMTPEERAAYRKQNAQRQKNVQFSAEVKARFDRGVQLMGQEMYDAAAEEFNKALEADPNQPGVLSRLAEAYTKANKYEEALAVYDKAIVANPADTNLYTSKGALLSKMKRTDESQQAFKKAAEMNPAAAAQNYLNLGITLSNGGQMEKAIEAFKQAIAADPGLAEAYYQLGMFQSGKQETIPAALEALRKYIQIGSNAEHLEVAKQLIAALEAKK